MVDPVGAVMQDDSTVSLCFIAWINNKKQRERAAHEFWKRIWMLNHALHDDE